MLFHRELIDRTKSDSCNFVSPNRDILGTDLWLYHSSIEYEMGHIAVSSRKIRYMDGQLHSLKYGMYLIDQSLVQDKSS